MDDAFFTVRKSVLCLTLFLFSLAKARCLRNFYFALSFIKESCAKKNFEVASPPRSLPPDLAPHSLRAIPTSA